MTENEKLDLILSETQGIKSEMQNMKSDIAGMKTEMQNMKSDIADMKTEMQNMQTDIQHLQTDVQDMKTDIQHLQTNVEQMNQKIIRIDLTIENEIRVNIQRVAEGHLDLSRALHDAMQPNKEVEMLSLRVRMLETDVGKLKEKIS